MTRQRSRRFSGVVLALLFSLVFACFTLSCLFAPQVFADQVEDNGWLYIADGLVPGNRKEDKHFVYGESGLLKSYDIYTPDGQYVETVFVEYYEEEFDEEGNLVSAQFEDTVGNTGVVVRVPQSQEAEESVAAEAEAEKELKQEVARTASRTAARLVSRRVASILAPKPQVPNAASKQKLTYKLDVERAATVLASAPQNFGGAANAFSGLAAGDQADFSPRWGVWANGQVTKMNSYESSSRYQGGLFLAMAGLDFRVTDALLAGLALGYEYSQTDTYFNDGSLNGNGFTIAPYFGYAILPTLTVDITGGITFLDYWSRRTDVFDYHADYSGLRSMVSSNVNYYIPWKNWTFSAHGGFMYTNEHTYEYTEKGSFGQRMERGDDNDYVGEFNAGLRAGYYFDGVEPYLALTYLYDAWLSGRQDQDRDEFEAAFGLNYQPVNNFLFGMELNQTFGRYKLNSTGVSIQARYEF